MHTAGNTARLWHPHHLANPLRNYLSRRYIEWLRWGFVEMYTADEWASLHQSYLDAGGTEARWNELFDERTFDLRTD